MQTYQPRLVDASLASLLARAGAVVIEGPKACGKTATARNASRSEVLFDVDDNARQAMEVAPALVLEGETPRLLDEWQVVPSIWNHVRRTVDQRAKPGQFILTGSAVPADDVVRHTGAGRLTRLRMRPMTLFETGLSTGGVSLASVFNGESQACGDPGLSLVGLVEAICVGGWPGKDALGMSERRKAVADYLQEVARTDISRVDGVQRDPARVLRLLRALARNVATEVTATSLATDVSGADGRLHDDTVREYLAALERLMVVEDQPAWAPHLRSRSVLRNSPKRHFVDPSLAVAALGATPTKLLADLQYVGCLFESLVVRELRVLSQQVDGVVFHYRDNTGLEVDAIVELADGRWAAFEVKLGVGQIDAAAETLLRFAERIDTTRSGEPAALAVVVGGGYGYRRPDGVQVIPVAALGP